MRDLSAATEITGVQPSNSQHAPNKKWIIFTALIMIGLHFGLRAWGTVSSWFFADDLMFLGVGNSGDGTIGWIFGSHNVHIMPIGRGLAVTPSWFDGYPWWLAATEILVMVVLAAFALLWMLKTIFGYRWGILIPLAVFLFNPLTAPATVWWAAALNQIPHAIALFVSLGFFTIYLRTKNRKPLILAMVFFVLGLASYSKSVLIGPLFFIYAFAYFSSGKLHTRIASTITNYSRAWAAIGGISGIYLIIYVNLIDSNGSLSIDLLLDMSNWVVFQSFLPGMIGGPLKWAELNSLDPRLISNPPNQLIIFAFFVLMSLFLRNYAKYQNSSFGLLLLFYYLVGHILIISLGRGMFGSYGGLETRYLYDVVAITALAFALSFMPVIGSKTHLRPRTVKTLKSRHQFIFKGIAIVAWLSASMYSTITYILPWHSDQSMPQKVFIRETIESAQNGSSAIADVWVPERIMSPLFFPYNFASKVFSPVAGQVTVTKSGNELLVFKTDGTLAPAFIEGEPRNLPGPVSGCGHLVIDEPTTIPIAGVVDFPFWMTINYLSGSPGQAIVSAGRSSEILEIEQGLHTGFVTTTGQYESVTITPLGNTALCVDEIRVGFLKPIDIY